MNMKLNFTTQSVNYIACTCCRKPIKAHEGKTICHLCTDDKETLNSRTPFEVVPEGQVLDDHLFPVTLPQSSVLTL